MIYLKGKNKRHLNRIIKLMKKHRVTVIDMVNSCTSGSWDKTIVYTHTNK